MGGLLQFFVGKPVGIKSYCGSYLYTSSREELALQVEAHGERPGSNVQVKTLRLPREGTVDDVLQQLANDQETGFENKKLRLMEILFNKIYKVLRGSVRGPSISLCTWETAHLDCLKRMRFFHFGRWFLL